MYTPSATLDPGTWYWQVGVVRKGSAKWSNVYNFTVAAACGKEELPSADALTNCAVEMRPRLMPDRNAVHALRGSTRFQDVALRLYHESAHLLDRDLPDDSAPAAKGKDDYQQMKFARWESKGLAGSQASAIDRLVCAALLSGDERYYAEAVRSALNIAHWDPDGFTNSEISDFADASCVRAMALVYDSGYDSLSGPERRVIRNAMIARSRRFYESCVNEVETRLFGGHLWQHLLREFFEAALTLVGDVPEARVWCRYIYELWIARFPLIAGDDGGWANGPKYFGTNVETLILMTSYFDRLGAKEFGTRPWFRNASKFLSYTWPPGSENDGFGDGTELENVPSASHLHWVDYLGHRFGDRNALDYVSAWQATGADATVSPRLALLSLQWKTPRCSKRKRQPKAVLFQDVGVVSAHSDVKRIARNVGVTFRSSPFGAFNHMHPCQNAFHLFYGGERLLANSGFYVAMADPHVLSWYRNTRGHNTILIDGQGQTRSPEGFGWIPRFIEGKQVTYWLGDASNAYGDAGLIRYRRQIALLHPDIVVIYDDLLADHEAVWTWQLHAQRKIIFNHRDSLFRSSNSHGKAELTFASSASFDVEIGDTFDPPVENWGNKLYQGREVDAFPKRWHANAVTAPKNGTRFLSIISVGKKTRQVRRVSDGFQVGSWKILAQMDPNTAASITVANTRRDVILASDVPAVDFGNRTYRARNCTLLIENGRSRRSQDELPAAAQHLVKKS